MKITETRDQQIGHCMPRRRGNVSFADLQVLNAIFTMPGTVACGAEFPYVSATGPVCQTALDPGDLPVVPPKSNRHSPGNTVQPCIASAMKSSASSGGSRGSVACFPALAGLMSYSFFLIYFALVFEALKLCKPALVKIMNNVALMIVAWLGF